VDGGLVVGAGGSGDAGDEEAFGIFVSVPYILDKKGREVAYSCNAHQAIHPFERLH